MVNSHDPHRPYYIPGQIDKKNRGAEIPSRIYKPEEVVVPGFLPDIPGVRREVSYYFNSVRRMDDTFGKVMQATASS
jgi:N-sulfoglucosamine sulfohydrolase